MNLNLSKRADYAVRAAVALARAYDDGGVRKIREVSEEMGLPLPYTPQILRLLAKDGLAEARAGREGGYRLSRPPQDVSLLAVVEAAEGPLRSDMCTLRGGPCHWEEMCAVHPAWEAATNALRDSLAGVSLRDVVDIDAGLSAGTMRASRTSHRKKQAKA